MENGAHTGKAGVDERRLNGPLTGHSSQSTYTRSRIGVRPSSGTAGRKLQETGPMKLKAKLAAALTLALLAVPNVAQADDNGRCDDAGMEDDCRDDRREKPKFQTKFFSE